MKKAKGLIHFPRGSAYVIRNGQEEYVESLETQTCDCHIDFCDCALIMTDLGTGDKYAIFMLDGVLSQATIEDFETFKESGDTDDLDATAYAPAE